MNGTVLGVGRADRVKASALTERNQQAGTGPTDAERALRSAWAEPPARSVSAHLDFKREGAGWLVWCSGAWRAVHVFDITAMCSRCGANLNERLRA